MAVIITAIVMPYLADFLDRRRSVPATAVRAPAE